MNLTAWTTNPYTTSLPAAQSSLRFEEPMDHALEAFTVCNPGVVVGHVQAHTHLLLLWTATIGQATRPANVGPVMPVNILSEVALLRVENAGHGSSLSAPMVRRSAVSSKNESSHFEEKREERKHWPCNGEKHNREGDNMVQQHLFI
ncbi:hypothetical protein BGZ82_011496 [Podila clonocystis]|nr:hypothetical protein BGZ82_011496 [Podila clonocystis]